MPVDFGGLLSKAKAPDLAPTPPMPPEEGDEDQGLMDRIAPIAQDLLEAIRGGDADAVADALIASHKAIAAGPSESSMGMMDDDGDEG